MLNETIYLTQRAPIVRKNRYETPPVQLMTGIKIILTHNSQLNTYFRHKFSKNDNFN